MEELCHVSGQLYAVLPVGGESFILNVARIVCEDFRGVMGINLRKSENYRQNYFCLTNGKMDFSLFTVGTFPNGEKVFHFSEKQF